MGDFHPRGMPKRRSVTSAHIENRRRTPQQTKKAVVDNRGLRTPRMSEDPDWPRSTERSETLSAVPSSSNFPASHSGLEHGLIGQSYRAFLNLHHSADQAQKSNLYRQSDRALASGRGRRTPR